VKSIVPFSRWTCFLLNRLAFVSTSKMVDEKSSQEGEKPQIVDVKDKSKTGESKEAAAGIKDYLRILTYSDKWDWAFNGVGAVAAMASGASLALYVGTPDNALLLGPQNMLTDFILQN